MLPAIDLTVGGDSIIHVPQIVEKYHIIKQIGYGSFAAVAMVRNKKTQQIFACKIVVRKSLIDDHMIGRFEQEIRLMQTFNHPNIIKTEEIIFDEQFIYVVMEHCANGELFTYLSSICFLPEREVCRILRQILMGLEYIHKRKVVHRDIKPENILLDRMMNVKLCDFGLCHMIPSDKLLSTPCGSPFYAAPEVIRNENYDGEKSDIWSAGIIAYTMATGVLPWTETNQVKLYLQISRAEIKMPNCFSSQFDQILRKMLAKRPEERPSVSELLALPFLSAAKPPPTHLPIFGKYPDFPTSNEGNLIKNQILAQKTNRRAPFVVRQRKREEAKVMIPNILLKTRRFVKNGYNSSPPSPNRK